MLTTEKEIETFYAAGRQEWRQWLQANHDKKQSIWLICYKKECNMPTVTWSESVDEALCFGWIDSTRKTIDDQRFIQFFTRRKPTSAWSKINKEKVARLEGEGLMAPAGLAAVSTAKQNGSWSVLDEVEELTVPADMGKALKAHPGAESYFADLSRSARKSILQWLVLAKRPETRQKRIAEIAELAGQQLKPKQFR